MNTLDFINKIKSSLENERFEIKQIAIIENVLHQQLLNKYIQEIKTNVPKNNIEAIQAFITSKRIEGCSDRTLKFYQNLLISSLKVINLQYYEICTEDVRDFISKYRNERNISKVTVDNLRRVISSFFSWLEVEDYIMKSPIRRIHKIKTDKCVKSIYSEETMELIRQNVTNKRDLAIVDMLYSTGIRVGELVRLNIDDIDFENKECVVFGKGNKQRKVYFDAKTKLHIQQYLASRNDMNDALFVSRLTPYERLQISGVEIALRKTGNKIGIRVHPHKFRRTLATKAIDKGMPIEQVQHLLGHSKIDTTLCYAMVNDINVKISHRKYLE